MSDALGGIGSCLVRESSSIVLGEYFRRRRQFVEQVVLAGTGVGGQRSQMLILQQGKSSWFLALGYDTTHLPSLFARSLSF